MLLNAYAAEKIAQDKMREARRKAEKGRSAGGIQVKEGPGVMAARAAVAISGLIAALTIIL